MQQSFSTSPDTPALRRQPRFDYRRWVLLLLVLLVTPALIFAPWPARADEAADTVDQIWQRVHQIGAYEFRANVIQDVVPVASIVNVGQSSERQELYLEGATDLRRQTLDMTLWSQGGSVFDRTSGLELKLEDDRLLARKGGSDWQEINNFTDALMPQGDFMVFLAGATDIRLADESLPAGETGTEQPPARYTYRIDGSTFAQHLRERVTAQMTRRGELALHAKLELPPTFTEMTGTGELWVRRDSSGRGLPLRQVTHLRFPEQDGHWVSAKLDVSFHFAEPTSTTASTLRATLNQALSDASHPLWQNFYFVTFLLIGGSLSLFLIVRRRATWVYKTLAALCIVSLVGSPLLQTAQAKNADDRFAARRARQQELLAQAQAIQDAPRAATGEGDPPTGLAALELIRNDNGRDSDGDGRSDVQEALLGTDPLVADQAAVVFGSQRAFSPTDTTDSDGDGLTDYEESLLGTAIDRADTDGDSISDGDEIRGFTYSGQTWYTDPLEADTNGDGVSDTNEWNSAERLHPTWDTDNDGTPDLWDLDNDGDGVPDRVDASPFLNPTTVFSDTHPFALSLNGLTAGKPTFVEFQVRPTNSDHLWYTLNKLDWPQDSSGNIQDLNNSSDDIDLIPMLEILIPDAPSNLPLTAAQVEVPITPSPYFPSNWNSNSPIQGKLVLRQDGNNIAVEATLSDAARLYIRRGTCDQPGERVGDEVVVARTGSGGTVALDPFDNVRLNERAGGGYIIQVGRNNDQITYGCGQIPLVPFEGDQMIDERQLQPYGISVRSNAVGSNAKTLYVPLQLVVDDPANLTNNRNLPATPAPKGGRVAFRGLMRYTASGLWNNAHQVRMVWTVQMKTDRPCPESAKPACTGYYDMPTVIHTYGDSWRLTGIDVREESGVDLAIAYEDPAVDNNRNDDVPLMALSKGLGDTFLAGRSDITTAEIARRFNHTTNGEASLVERWGISNTLGVATAAYPTLDQMARDTVDRSQTLLNTTFSGTWATQAISPTLLYAYTWTYRALNLDAHGKLEGVSWNSNNTQLTFDFKSTSAPLQTLAGVKLQPYRYDGSQWRTFEMADFWQELKRRYDPIIATAPIPDEAKGQLGAVMLYYFTLNNGVQQTIAIGGDAISFDPLSDTEISNINTAVSTVYTIGYVPQAIVETAMTVGRSEGFIRFLKISIVDALFDQSNTFAVGAAKSFARSAKTFTSALNRSAAIIVGAFVITAALVVTQLALTIVSIVGLWEFDAATNKAITIGLAVINAVTMTYLGIVVPIRAAQLTAQAAGETMTVLNLTNKLSGIKAANVMAVIGFIIQMGVVWGYFIYAVASGQASSGTALHSALSFAIASTLVALLYLAITLIPVIGPIIVAILSVIDFLLTAICEIIDEFTGEGNNPLRGVVTPGSGSCFTLAGALTETLMGLFYQSDIIFKFDPDPFFSHPLGVEADLDKGILPNALRQAFANNGVTLGPEAVVIPLEQGSKWQINAVYPRAYTVEKQSGATTLTIYKDWQERFPNLSGFDTALAHPNAGLVQGNILRFKATVGGHLAPSTPKANVGDTYDQWTIQRTGIAVELSTAKNDALKATPENLQYQPWRFTQVATMRMTILQSLFPPFTTKSEFPLYLAGVPDQQVQTAPITLTTAGINTDYMTPVYLNVGMQIPLYSCIMAFCEQGKEFSSQSLPATTVVDAPKFTLDILPPTLDAFYARNWGRYQHNGKPGGIAFAPPVDFDGDGLRNTAANGLDPDDTKSDTDGDGAPDAVEMLLRQLGVAKGGALMNFNTPDTDGDGLCDGDEIRLGTRADLADTDGDGLSDAEEVWHRNCASGAWEGGWIFTYGDGRTTRVNSDPLTFDSDGDGMSDLTERRLHQLDPVLYGFHPQVKNAGPVGIEQRISDRDAVVLPGDSLVYTATVYNNLTQSFYAGGNLVTTFPAVLGGQSKTDPFTIFKGGRQSFATTLTAGGGSQHVVIQSDLTAQLLASAESAPGATPAFVLGEGKRVTIDDDLPTSSLTSGSHVQAGGFRLIGGLAGDPTSYIQRVDVQIVGQTDWETAVGGEAWAYTWDVPTSEGRYTVQSRAVDAVGHEQNPVAAAEVIVDGTPPVPTANQSGNPILPAKRDAQLRWTVALDGIVGDPASGGAPGSGVAKVEVRLEPQSSGWVEATLDGAGNWTINYPLSGYDANNQRFPDATGEYTVQVRATDRVQNQTAAADYLTYQVRVDTTPPVATLDALGRVTTGAETVSVDQTLFITRNLVLTGTATDPGLFAAGVSGVEIAFTPAELLDTLDTPSLLLFFNEPVGVTSYTNAAPGGTNAECSGDRCPRNDETGIYGGAVAFDGSNDVITATINISEANLTVSLWFNTTNPNGGLFAATAGALGSAGADRALYLVNGNLCAFVQGVQADEICTAGTSYNDGQWHQAVLVLDGAAPFRLYIDGSLGAAAGLVTSSTLAAQSGLTVGFARDRNGANRFLTGRIDEVEIYSGALSAAAVAALYRRWQPVTLAASGPGVSTTTWSYQIPDGLEGLYQIDLRAGDVNGNRNDELRGRWKQWRGLIDTTAPRITLNSYFDGAGATAQTTYQVTVEDYMLTETGYNGPCALQPADYHYDESPFWQQVSNGAKRLNRFTSSCTVNGLPVRGEEVRYAAVTACDSAGRCTQAREDRDVLYWSTLYRSTTQNAPFSNIRRANLNGGYQREELLDGLPRITGLAIDNDRGHLYWLERDTATTGRVRRSDLDGQNVTPIPLNPPPALSEVTFPATFDLAVNPQGGKLYWSEESQIKWANLDGSGVATLFTLPTGPNPRTDRIGGMVVDSANGKIYFGAIDLVTNSGDALAATSDSQIWVINADGSNPTVLVDFGVLKNVAVIGLALAQDKTRLYWTQRKRFSDRASSGDGLFSVATSGGAPALVNLGSVSFISILEVSPNARVAPASHPNFAYWSAGSLIQQVDLASGAAGYFAYEQYDLIGASATARIAGLSTSASDLELRKQAGAEIVASGGLVTYRLTVRNHGPLAAGGVTVVSTLPANTTFVAGGSSPQCTPSGVGQVTCDLGQLTDGAKRNLVIQVQVAAGTGATLTHNLTVSSNQPDPKPANNSLSFAETLVALPPTPVPATARYLYWGYEGTLNRTRADGSGSETVVGYPTLANETVQGVVVDGVNGHIYFASRPNALTGAGHVRRINLDGTGLTTIYTDESAPWPTTLALDAANNRLYFTHGGEYNGDAIKRINLDGSGETVVVSNLMGPTGLAVNLLRGELYWSDGSGRLMRAGLDGSNPQVIAGDTYAFDITVDPYADLIYYRTRNPLAIYRILRSGEEHELVVKDGTGAHGPALDVSNNKLYWIDGAVFANIRQSDLDGSNAMTIGSAGVRPTSQLALAFTDAPIVPTATATATNAPIPAATPTPLPTPTPGGPPAAENLYWSNEGGEIVRAPVAGCLDGSCIQPVVTPSPGTSAGDIAVDSLRGKLYWINPVDKSIQRSNVDGSDPQTLLSGLADPRGITLDERGARIYWTDFTAGVIRSAALDGSDQLTVTTGLTNPIWIDFAPGERRLYFVQSNQIFDNRDDRLIRRINPDGSDLVNIVVGYPGGPVPNIDFEVTGLTVNEAIGRLYWMDQDDLDGGYYRLNWVTLDGAAPNRVVYSNVPSLRGLTHDRNAFSLYWAAGYEGQYSFGPPFVIQRGFAEGELSGQPVITITAGLGDQSAAPFDLALHYPAAAPATCLADSSEPNDAVANATAAQVGTPLTDRNFHTGSDVDWFVINLTSGLRYRFSAQAAGSDADTLLDLYLVDGTTLLASNDDLVAGQTDSQLVLDAPLDGNYFARVSNRVRAAALPCNNRYTFSVQPFQDELPNDDPGTRLLNPLPANYTPPLLDSTILTPTDGMLLDNLGVTTVHGAAMATNGIGTLAVTLNGAGFYNVTPGGGITQTTWSQPWTPAAEGSYLFNSVVTDSSNHVQTRTRPITVVVDLAVPQVTLDRTVYTQTHLAGPNQVNFTGNATDTNGVVLVEVSVAGTLWQGATVTGATWRYPWVIAGNRDGGSFVVDVRATDKAGRTATTNANVTIDVAGPQLPPITITRPGSAAAVRSVASQQADLSLTLTWSAANDSNGVRGYYVGFTTSPTPDLSALTFYAAAGVHTQTLGEAQVVYGHVVAVDTLGNQTVQTVGPFVVDGPATPDRLGNLSDTNWLATGGSQLGADREVGRGPFAKAAFGATQEFYLSWNEQALGLAWVGADWAGDGDLFIYLDTGAGGATQLYNPYPTLAAIDLPPGMAAQYVVWVKDAVTAQLLQATGGDWNLVTTLSNANFRLNGGQTHLYLPFSLLGLNNTSPLGVVAVASEENVLRLWAAAPDKNPLNSERSINPAASERDLSNYQLTLHHRWPTLALGQIPNAGRFTDSDLQITMVSKVDSVAVGYLESDLLDLLTPNQALDGSRDGQADVALPGNANAKALGNGATIQYTIHYANRGPETARNVTLALTGAGGLNVIPTVNLGDIAPGAEGAVDVTATINGATAGVELLARLSDEAHGPYDWFWFVHAVDTAPPTNQTITAPTAIVRAGSQIVRGTVQDASGVPTLIVEVSGTSTTCSDPTPNDGLWSCIVDFSGFAGGATVSVRVQAVDEHGNASAFSNPVTLLVDNAAPTVTFDSNTEAALADGFITASETLFRGLVIDDLRADRLEICIPQPAGFDSCTTQQTQPRDSANGQWTNLLFTDNLDGITQTMRLVGVDAVGNRSAPDQRTFRIDTVPPVVTAALGVTGISGAVRDGSGVQIVRLRVEPDGGAPYWINAEQNGAQWSLTFENSAAGRYRLFVEAADLVGNVSATGPFVFTAGSAGIIYLPVIIKEGAPASHQEENNQPLNNQVYMPMINKE